MLRISRSNVFDFETLIFLEIVAMWYWQWYLGKPSYGYKIFKDPAITSDFSGL